MNKVVNKCASLVEYQIWTVYVIVADLLSKPVPTCEVVP